MSYPKSFKTLNKRNLQSVLETNLEPVLLYFYSPDVRLCDLISPEIEKICNTYAPATKKVAINTDEQKDVTYEYRITQAPSFILYYNEEEVRRLSQFDYNDQFQRKFREFLVGDFLFSLKKYNSLDEMDYFSNLREWYYFNLIGFMKPGDPINWQLERMLRELYDQHSDLIRIHLVNGKENESLLTQYKLMNLPAMILAEETEVLKKWHPASNPDKIKFECLEIVDQSEKSRNS